MVTADGAPMNAVNDYVIRMPRNELPPANAFWSFTLYDAINGFFIPNKHQKYSVGENAGMKLNIILRVYAPSLFRKVKQGKHLAHHFKYQGSIRGSLRCS
jgi:hypothetical protein